MQKRYMSKKHNTPLLLPTKTPWHLIRTVTDTHSATGVCLSPVFYVYTNRLLRIHQPSASYISRNRLVKFRFPPVINSGIYSCFVMKSAITQICLGQEKQ